MGHSCILTLSSGSNASSCLLLAGWLSKIDVSTLALGSFSASPHSTPAAAFPVLPGAASKGVPSGTVVSFSRDTAGEASGTILLSHGPEPTGPSCTSLPKISYLMHLLPGENTGNRWCISGLCVALNEGQASRSGLLSQNLFTGMLIMCKKIMGKLLPLNLLKAPKLPHSGMANDHWTKRLLQYSGLPGYQVWPTWR